MEIFDAICRGGSLTEAARLLHISQPAASKLLATAEMQLGFRLFERVRGRLVPTREAGILAPHVARLHQELGDVGRLARNLRFHHQGLWRIGSSPAFGLELLPMALSRCRQAHPAMSFELRTHHSGELLQALETRDLDMVLTFDQREHPGLQRQVLAATQLVHVVPQGTAPLRSWDDMAQRTFIALDAQDPVGAMVERLLDAHILDFAPVMRVQTHYVACALVLQGAGEALVDLVTARAMLRPGLCLHRLPQTLDVPVSVLTVQDDAGSGARQAVLDHIRVALQQCCFPGDWTGP
ncbi:LysR substrate-binding domain-containing protein [Alcaligenes sp. SDU_A2]|uniref:LysR family transcriptional regulator n=1 Tax=Alcaligenes sp. SDU_A2 TaxID=3136634 RepID=UPI002CF885D0|nr:LysR substrate-binding domain-containing protein [Alcaligenes sp.]HRL26273.1 LysR substrate-binding domain-containing protein [Alcaligenes sp.]